MSSPNVHRWVIAAPCAMAVGVAIAFGSWHFRDTDFLKHVRGDRASSQAGPVSGTESRIRSGSSPELAAGSPTALPSLTEGATVIQEDPLPTPEAFAAILEQEKKKAAHAALTSYILSNEDRTKLEQTTGHRPPDHPLVEELINKPNSMRSATGNTLIPGGYGNEGAVLGGFAQHVLRDPAQMFQSPALAPLQANARATTDMTLSALMQVQGELKSRLEGGGFHFSNNGQRALGNLLTNALAGSSRDGTGPAGRAPVVGSYMTPPVGSPLVPAFAGVESSELAAATALIEEYRRLLPSLSDAEMKEYLRRVETEGKVAAMLWVVRTKQAAK